MLYHFFQWYFSLPPVFERIFWMTPIINLKSTNCSVLYSHWSCEERMITFKIEANRFLHHMIRYLVGTMIGVCQGRISAKEFKLLINYPKKNVQILKAPPQGLLLEKIRYD